MNMQQVIDSEAAAPVRNSRLAGEVATRTLNLALQGGGAHGAFTWGVLNRRRGLLGRRLHGQPGNLSPDLWLRVA